MRSNEIQWNPMKSDKGDLLHDREGIADVFASFYADLYKSRGTSDDGSAPTRREHSAIEPFNHKELDEALRAMKNEKAKDKSGIVAEMLKVNCKPLQDAILNVFNDVAAHDGVPPAQRCETRIVAIFKNGDEQLPSNYRPVAILPILYKLLSRMVCGRI